MQAHPADCLGKAFGKACLRLPAQDLFGPLNAQDIGRYVNLAGFGVLADEK